MRKASLNLHPRPRRILHSQQSICRQIKGIQNIISAAGTDKGAVRKNKKQNAKKSEQYCHHTLNSLISNAGNSNMTSPWITTSLAPVADSLTDDPVTQNRNSMERGHTRYTVSDIDACLCLL